MRIALLPSAFAPRVGGVEILTDRLARGLQANGHAVEVWTARSRDDATEQDEIIDALRIRRFIFDAPRAAPKDAAAWPARGFGTLRSMLSALHDFRPDLLHVQCFSTNGVYATALSALSRIPLVVTLQGETFMDDHDIYDRSLFLRTGIRLGLRRAHRITGCSRYTLADADARFSATRHKSEVVFNGVDLDEAAASLWTAPFGRYVLALGRVVHRKGFDLLIEAWSRIANRHQDVGLVIGGTGQELPRLHGLVASLGLADRVRFAGPMARGDVASAMVGADVFVMPSRVEAFGIVVLEAWQAGTSVVVTANGGPPEFVEDGVSGLVVDPFDNAALADAIDHLLANGDLRRHLATAASARLDEFRWPEITRQYEAVYVKALGGPG